MSGKAISHYKIIEKLGEGGMVIAYKAHDAKLDRFVALKFLPPDLSSSDEEKRRFVHEAKAASALEDNNICNIHKIDETEDGQLLIDMPTTKANRSRKKMSRDPLKLEEAIDIARQTAEGLTKAHQKKIVHCDLKQANVL